MLKRVRKAARAVRERGRGGARPLVAIRTVSDKEECGKVVAQGAAAGGAVAQHSPAWVASENRLCAHLRAR